MRQGDGTWATGSSGSCVASLVRGAGLPSILAFSAGVAGRSPLSTLSALGTWTSQPLGPAPGCGASAPAPIFGTVTVRTPFSKFACTCSGSTGKGSREEPLEGAVGALDEVEVLLARPCARTSSHPGWRARRHRG